MNADATRKRVESLFPKLIPVLSIIKARTI